MPVDIGHLQLLFTVVSLSEAMLCRQYKGNIKADNKGTTQAPSDILFAASLLTCVSLCGNGCQCVSHNSQTKMCSLHSSCGPYAVSEKDWKTYTIVKIQPSSCQDLYTCGQKTSGVYTIYPWERSDPNYRPVQVYCDMETEGGGWTAIQRRVNGGKSFKQNWVDYKTGFGSPHEDYWIGNDVIHQLTKGTNSSLYVEISPRLDNYTFYQVFRDFSISSEDQKYKLQLANPGNGCHLDAGSFLYHNNMPFSTFDADNDGCNCPALYSAGWWFKCCHNTNLNGPWSPETWFFPWYPQFLNGTNINGTLMLVRPQ